MARVFGTKKNRFTGWTDVDLSEKGISEASQFDIQPPSLDETDKRNPKFCIQYRNEAPGDLPLAESLKDTVARTVPYFNDVIKRDMEQGKRVIIAAHGNSLRALVKHFYCTSDQEIIDVNIPTGVPLVYEFDENFAVIHKYYLADENAIKLIT